jgi:hypothetical protein
MVIFKLIFRGRESQPCRYLGQVKSGNGKKNSKDLKWNMFEAQQEGHCS